MPIVYSSTKKGFIEDVLGGSVEQRILACFVRETGHSTAKNEIRSWRESMMYMSNNVLQDSEIPDDVGVAIEYKIPRTSKRIDFIITGTGSEGKGSAVIIELKQWSGGVKLTDKDGVVNTDFFGEVNHPSYQAWSYATLIEDYNEDVRKNGVVLAPCAYLHNYEDGNVILNDFYKVHLENAPVFLKSDAEKLRTFIKKFVKYGDKNSVLFLIEKGRIKPSKSLADSLSSMLEGNREFVLIDDQKLVYETALKLAKESGAKNKKVLIVDGGPGTGKSVVAINLLTAYTKIGYLSQYVTRNSAPREVYQIKLTGKMTKTRIANMFTSSGSFFDVDANTLDALIIDEAHRLSKKSGLFSNLGENQIKELICASKFSVFFIDEDQRVTTSDIGTKEVIEKWAKKLKAGIYRMELSSQFRCNGSDGYLAWIDEILQIRDTANDTLEGINFDFRVIDDPAELHGLIKKHNLENNKSRVVAGYCWNWISKNKPELKDITIDEYTATWNLNTHGQGWIVRENSVEQIGCIHTCQGLELDYVGVIIGSDFVVREGRVVTDLTKRASTDQSLKGLKSLLKDNPVEANKTADRLIKNTYRTLLTRGMKGCYIYCTDTETQKYFKERLLMISKNIYSNNNNNDAFLKIN